MEINLSGPDIGDREKELVNEVLDSRWLALGPMLKKFEVDFAHYVDTKYAVATNSGTSGLHLIVRALNIGAGDEVITTPFSFIASSNCLLFEDAVPVFVDIDPHTWSVDTERMEQAVTEKTKAVLAVDVFGQPADMTEIMKFKKKYGLKIIEDSCEAVGAEHKGIRTGRFADASIFAFYPNKQITTGEGGMIVTDDRKIEKLCRSMVNQGRGDEGGWLNHVRLGFNYRMDEMSAALGLAQLERIDEILKRRAAVAEEYTELLEDLPEVKTMTVSEKTTRMSWFVYVVQFSPHIDRDQVMKYLQDRGVGCKPYFTPIHLQPFYRKRFGFQRGDFPVCEKVCDSVLALPFYTGLKNKDVRKVVELLKEALFTVG